MNNRIEKLTSSVQQEIEMWDEQFKVTAENRNKPPKHRVEYGEILDYLDVYSMKNYFDRVTRNRMPYDDENKFAYVVRARNGEVAAFTLFVLKIRTDVGKDMFIQSIVTNPKYRHKGYAKYLLETIFSNPMEYIGTKPIDVGALVDKWNDKSLNLFDKFGEFEKHKYGRYTFFIIKDYKSIEQTLSENLTK